MEEIAEPGKYVEGLQAENGKLRERIENLLRQNHDIAASNADHVGWHRDMVLQVEEYRKATLCSCAEDPLAATVHLGDCAWKNPAIEKLHRDGLRRPVEKRVEPSQKKLCGTWVPEMGPCVAEVPCKAHPEKQNEPLHLNSTRCADCGASLTDGHGH